MNLSSILIVLISCTAMESVYSQILPVPMPQMPPIPMPPIPLPSLLPLPMPPMLHDDLDDDARVRRSAQVPEPATLEMRLEQRNRRSVQTEAPPTHIEQRNRRNAQTESVMALATRTAPLKQRNRRSAPSAHIIADFQDLNIVGNVEDAIFGIRGRRAAQG